MLQFVFACTHTHMHTHILTYTHTHMHTHILTYTHTYIHTHIHTHTHYVTSCSYQISAIPHEYSVVVDL